MQPQNPLQPTNKQTPYPGPVSGDQVNANQHSSLVNNDMLVQPLTSELQPSALTNPAHPQKIITPQSVSSSFYTKPTTYQTNQPSSPNDTYVGLTGSQIKKEKKPLPIGVYIIAGFILIGFVISFFDTSQNSGIYIIVMFADLLLAIGLLIRLQVARKIIIWLQALALVLSVASLFLLIGTQQRLNTLKTNYETAINRIDQSKLTPTQKQQLDNIQNAIVIKEKQTGKTITFSYFKLGATSVASLVVIIYLTRPKVKEVFHDLEA